MRKYKLGELLSIKHGWAFKGEYFSDTGEQSILTPGNFYDRGGFKRNAEKDRYYTGEYPKEYLSHKGDLIVAMTEQAAGLLGSTAIVPEDNRYLHNQRIGLITCKPELDKMFAYYLFMTKTVREQISRSSSGTKVKHTSPEKIYDVEVTIPDIEDQKKIAALLWKIDCKIEANNQINDNLQQMAKTIYDYWFLQKEFPDKRGKPYKSSGGKMVWSTRLNREIPEGWSVAQIKNLITTERGISYSTPNIKTGRGVPMINLASFMPGGGNYKPEGLKFYLGDYSPNKVLHPFDLVMCNTQQTAIKFETDIIGRAMLVPDIFNTSIVFSHHVNIIRTKNTDLKYYLLYFFNSDFFHKYISGFTNGTNILGLLFNGVEDYWVEVPDGQTIADFAKQIHNIEKQKSEILKENAYLTELRNYLLPLLMNGQATITD